MTGLKSQFGWGLTLGKGYLASEVSISDNAYLWRVYFRSNNDDWNWETELNRTPHWREQLIAEIEGRPIGFIQIIDPALEDSHYWGEMTAGFRAIDIWIGEEADLGKGYGTQMMQVAIEKCFAEPSVTAILVDPLASNRRAYRFYERLGFKFVEFRRFGPDECHVYRLHRADWHPDHKNPLLKMY